MAKVDIVVLGAGPGGYAAAFYAADKGRKVVLVERDPRLGGVCLNRGCIPSKALLHATHQITSARESAHRGIVFDSPKVDLAKLRAWKESILTRLGGGIAQLAKMRGVQVLNGRGHLRRRRKRRSRKSASRRRWRRWPPRANKSKSNSNVTGRKRRSFSTACSWRSGACPIATTSAWKTPRSPATTKGSSR